MTHTKCTATTRLSADECLQRLADCPALQRGERTSWAYRAQSSFDCAGLDHASASKWHRHGKRSGIEGAAEVWRELFHANSAAMWMRRHADPVRRLREERRDLRRRLAQMSTAFYLMDAANRILEAATTWCPIGRQQPPTAEPVLLLVDGSFCEVGWRDKDGRLIVRGRDYTEVVSHWMPFRPPPLPQRPEQVAS